MGAGTVVIVGASHAAVQAIDTLRREGHDGRIVLVGDEPHLPYNRPPLSKKYLSGEMERERLYLRSAQYYEQSRTEVRLGVRVTAIDRTHQRLRLGDGDELQPGIFNGYQRKPNSNKRPEKGTGRKGKKSLPILVTF